MFRICKQFRFEAAHSLPHLGPSHKCARPHGHSYRVEVVLESAELDARGFCAADYAELDRLKDYLDEHFDHRDLNEVFGGSLNPTTAENLARYLFNTCAHWWPELKLVRVCETEPTWVEYDGDEPMGY